jgi:predicted deacylase
LPLSFKLPLPDLSAERKGNVGIEGVWHFDSGQPGPKVAITALIHGNEICGAWALKELLNCGLKPEAGELILIFANLAAFDRFDIRNHDASRFVDEDLNRVWTDERIATGTSIECRRAAELMPWLRRADWLLDLHSMHEAGAPLLLTGLQLRNLALAREMGASAQVIIDAGHSNGVRLRDYAHWGQLDAQAPESRSLLIECGFHGDPSSRDVAKDMVYRFLIASGLFKAPSLDQPLVAWLKSAQRFPRPLVVTGAVVARSENFRFTRAVEGLQHFPEAGTVIGDNDGELVRTPHSDCVLVMPSVRQARAGVTVVRFARYLAE